MAFDPLKSAIFYDKVDYTSLALPSVNQYQSGQQRVMDQVQTLTRSKQRQSRGSAASAHTPASPISPLFDHVFTDSFKSLPPTLNGSKSVGNGLSKLLSQETTANRRIVSGGAKRSTVQRNSYLYEQASIPVIPVTLGRANTSRSEPDITGRFVQPNRALPSRSRLLSNKSNTLLTERASQFVVNGPPQPQPPPGIMNGTAGRTNNNRNSQFVVNQIHVSGPPSKEFLVDGASKKGSKGDSGSLSTSGIADMTMRDAVEYLSNKDEIYQHCGASFIQHNTYIEDAAKQEVVLNLHGVVPLVGLLRSPNPQVYQTASAALRNLSFKNSQIKEEVHRCGGIRETAALLRETDSSETQKQLTGLLWNLSSQDSLKPDLVKSALPVLMESVILPYTKGPDRTTNYSPDPDVFFHATGCLRNLSSSKQSNRQAMRKCRGLVDSLVGYVQNCVAANRPDDKSVENCACILHNLTFQLEAEAPGLFNRISALSKTASKRHSQGDTGPIGCFSSQSSKVLEQERRFDYPVVEELHPEGAGWLIHSKTLQSYLSLMGSSQQDNTLEACCGALQNLTATQGIVSSVMSHTIVQKLNGLQVIAPLLKSPKPNLQRNSVALVGNLAQNQNLQSAIARKALPELTGILSSGTKEGNESDDTLAMACQTALSLLRKEPELGKRLLSNDLINSLKNLSQNKYFPKASKGASLLLYSLWSDKELQSFLKKQGMNKATFVNDVTMAALKSVQVVE